MRRGLIRSTADDDQAEEEPQQANQRAATGTPHGLFPVSSRAGSEPRVLGPDREPEADDRRHRDQPGADADSERPAVEVALRIERIPVRRILGRDRSRACRSRCRGWRRCRRRTDGEREIAGKRVAVGVRDRLPVDGVGARTAGIERHRHCLARGIVEIDRGITGVDPRTVRPGDLDHRRIRLDLLRKG